MYLTLSASGAAAAPDEASGDREISRGEHVTESLRDMRKSGLAGQDDVEISRSTLGGLDQTRLVNSVHDNVAGV